MASTLYIPTPPDSPIFYNQKFYEILEFLLPQGNFTITIEFPLRPGDPEDSTILFTGDLSIALTGINEPAPSIDVGCTTCIAIYSTTTGTNIPVSYNGLSSGGGWNWNTIPPSLNVIPYTIWTHTLPRSTFLTLETTATVPPQESEWIHKTSFSSSHFTYHFQNAKIQSRRLLLQVMISLSSNAGTLTRSGVIIDVGLIGKYNSILSFSETKSYILVQ